MTPKELEPLLKCDESYRIERTISISNMRYVNMFNHGVHNVQALLKANGSKEADFDVSLLTVFKVDVEDANVTDQKNGLNIPQVSTQVTHQVTHQATHQVKCLVLNMEDNFKSMATLMKLTKLSPSSRTHFRRTYLRPAIELGLIEFEIKDNPRHPKQRYRLTELGLAVKAELQKE